MYDVWEGGGIVSIRYHFEKLDIVCALGFRLEGR